MSFWKSSLLFLCLISFLIIPLSGAVYETTPLPTRIPIIPQVLVQEQPAIPIAESAPVPDTEKFFVPGEYPIWPAGKGYDVRYVPGQVLVRFDPGGIQGRSGIALADSVNAKMGAEMVRDYADVSVPGLQLVKIPETMSVQDAVASYSSTPGVLYAEPDLIFSSDKIPDDPEFWRQYGLSNTGSPYKENTPAGTAGADIHASDGWNTATSTNGTIIAVIDTGVDIGHPDLTDNLWYTDAYGYRRYGFNVISGEYFQPWDDDGHGTHCAGIIGMIGDNQLGGTGVAWNTSIMAIKALNNLGTAKLSDLVYGMAYASSNHVPVVSCSFSISVPEPLRPRSMEDIILSSDSLFVCAAGNDGNDTGEHPEYPACFQADNLISVASTDADDNLSPFSNWGNRTIHVAAPGSLIYSTLPSDYSWNYIWQNPSWSRELVNLTGNWTIHQPQQPGAPVILYGVIPEGKPNETLVIEMTHPVNVTDDLPTITWDWLGSFIGTMRIEYTLDGVHWTEQMNTNGKAKWENGTQFFSMFPTIQKGDQMKVRISFWPTSPAGFVDLAMINPGIGYRENVTKPNYDYQSGTSMATPMVAGVAGLLKGTCPNLTAQALKLRIMEAVDPLPSLQGKTVTGGKVNLSAALRFASPVNAIPLEPGWNHVSVPRYLQVGEDTARIFAGVQSAGHSVLMYTNDQVGWKPLNATDPVIPLQGYWLFSENVTTVPVRFAQAIPGPVRQVGSGWSSVGGWSDVDLSANVTLSSLGTSWSYLFGYDAASQRYDEVIIRGGNGSQSDKRPVKPWQGYWLYCTENGTYQGPLT